MSNSYDTDGRGPTTRQLNLAGLALVVVAVLVVAGLLAKSRGVFDDRMQVVVELVDVGDGLPAKSDVKFRGALVGTVTGVEPAPAGQANMVYVDLKRSLAVGIPDTVTARVVPSNVFAVSAVQLVDNGWGSRPLQSGAAIREDQSLPTILFQSTLTKFRKVFQAIGRSPTPESTGLLQMLGQATAGRRGALVGAGRDLRALVTRLNTVVGDGDQSTISALTEAVHGLQAAAPDLFDALDTAVRPMRTLAEKQSALREFLSAGAQTLGTAAAAFDNQTDRLIGITTQLTPVLGVLADNGKQFAPIFTRLQRVANKFYDEAWNPDTNLFAIKAVVSFTPTRTYVRADCPRYGAMEGPSCRDAPEIPTAPALLPALASQGMVPRNVPENRSNLAPPRNSVLAPAELEPAPQEQPVAPAPAPGQEVAHPAAFGGSVGPVGSNAERIQLGHIIGGEATAATQLLLGPVARGTTVHLAAETEKPQ